MSLQLKKKEDKYFELFLKDFSDKNKKNNLKIPELMESLCVQRLLDVLPLKF